MNTLVTAPFSSEMGWELCTWIPYLRFMAPQFDHIICGCDPAMEYYYKDFAHRLYHRRNPGKGDRWLDHGKITSVPGQRMKTYRKYHPKIIAPNEQNCTAWKKRKWFKYGEYKEELKYDIVIHARRLKRFNKGYRNWRLERWGELVDYHPKLKICSIGLEDKKHGHFHAFHVPGTDDKRNVSAEELCNILASSRVTMGPSSGPMHLAHLCGCPIIVWTDSKWQKALGRKKNNRYRYEKLWRAWPDVHVKVLDKTWRPQVRIINQALTNFFEYSEKGITIPRRKK